MDFTVTFKNLITNISVNPALTFKQVQFVHESGMSSVNQENEQSYPQITGIKVFGRLDEEPKFGRKVQEELEIALYIAEETFTGLIAKTQGFCYLAKPITCEYNGKAYCLDESWWGEQFPYNSTIHGGDYFLDEASFIDEEKNFHPMFHFYRAAKDETNPNDYRALNAWRFLEALHGKSDALLKEYLIDHLGLNKKFVENFYRSVRCAIAHAQLLKKNPLTKDVILPKSYETQFDGGLFLKLSDILDYLDEEVKKLSPEPTDIRR